MKHKAIGAALIAAVLQVQAAHGATALEYAVHAQLPRGESVSGTLRLGDRSRGPLVDVLNASNAVAEAGAGGKNSVQVTLGPDRACITLTVSTRGATVTASGTGSMPPPPPPQGRSNDNGEQQPPPPEQGPPRQGPRGDASANVRIVVTLDHQRLASARGTVSPARDARGPHLEWTLEKVGQ